MRTVPHRQVTPFHPFLGGREVVADPPVSALRAALANAAPAEVPDGLSAVEARQRLQTIGPNSVPDTTVSAWRRALGKFWAPVPWMLEAAIVLQLVQGAVGEAAIIVALLVLNAALGLFQEGRAQSTLTALKSRLALIASVRRDSVWKTVPAAELVPGDVVKLSLGSVVAADVRITSGEVLLDQSMLSGESAPIEGGPGLQTFAGALCGAARRSPRSPPPGRARSSAAPRSSCAPHTSLARVTG